jgi:hypothetical protein
MRVSWASLAQAKAIGVQGPCHSSWALQICQVRSLLQEALEVDMPIRQSLAANRTVVLVGIATLLFVLFGSRGVTAQERDRPLAAVGAVLKGVALDPTTYVPAALGYDATMQDWNTSQVFFRNGYVEHNRYFTVSGLPNDRAISYGEGSQQILRDALANLQVSLMNNFADQVVERILLDRYPAHPRLIKTLGWIERIGVGSALAYKFSAGHFRQAAYNRQLAGQLGLH